MLFRSGMALQRMLPHRMVQVLRVVLPIIILGLAGELLRNYFSRASNAPGAEPLAQTLPQNLAVLNKGFRFSQTEGGRTVFTVNAETNLGFQDGKQLLQNVEVLVQPEKDGDPVRRLFGREGSYDENTKNFDFRGDVVAQLDERTTAYTQELRYNYQTRAASSVVPTNLEQLEIGRAHV